MSIRQLRDDEPLPAGEPRKYLSDRGYVRLRWLVAPTEYVEVYEHRAVVGRPPGMEVHHIDGIKTNNHATNLQVMTPSDHALLHLDLARAAGKFAGRRIARERVERKASREALWDEIGRLYQLGFTTTEIGLIVDRDCSNISRGLRARGYTLRTPWQSRRTARPVLRTSQETT